VRTVILGPPPPEVVALIESRRSTGADRFDEVWEGDLHMNPAPHGRHQWLGVKLIVQLDPLATRSGLFLYEGVNVGEPDDYRIPDVAILRERLFLTYYPTAALVVEVLSPGDESRQKFGFYAAHGVEELVIVDPATHTVEWYRSDGTTFGPVDRSDLLGIDVADFTSQIDWPPAS